MTIQDYLNLVTSEYQNSVNFLSVISNLVAVPVQVQSLMTSMIILFDLDTPPVGDQLDIIGLWVGASRNLNEPITGVYFTWDGDIEEGWDYGTWAPPNQPNGIITLTDAAYLNLIRGKIAANSWDGTLKTFYSILQSLFPQYLILLVDNQDMSYRLGIIGDPVDSLTLALFTGGYIPMRPEGVEVTDYFTNFDSGPLFAWDSDTTLLQGWDTGSWVIELEPT